MFTLEYVVVPYNRDQIFLINLCLFIPFFMAHIPLALFIFIN